MTQLITSPNKFAYFFNAKVPGAYRKVSGDDIGLLTQCGLIGRYGFYDTTNDLQTVIGLLSYEQLRGKMTQHEKAEAICNPPLCRLCGKPLPKQPEGKRGRPREYCPDCESSRATMRGHKWRKKMKAARRGEESILTTEASSV